MFHLVTTCVCRLNHIHLCIHDLVGPRVREITTDGGVNYYLLYNERNEQLLLRQDGTRLCCINLDGHVIYRYDIAGYEGLAVDRQSHVYISGRHSNDIKRLSPDGTLLLNVIPHGF
jgi:sugar lactone lactonase YvrE